MKSTCVCWGTGKSWVGPICGYLAIAAGAFLLAGSFFMRLSSHSADLDWPSLAMKVNFGADWQNAMRCAAYTNRLKFDRMRAVLEECFSAEGQETARDE